MRKYRKNVKHAKCAPNAQTDQKTGSQMPHLVDSLPSLKKVDKFQKNLKKTPKNTKNVKKHQKM
jgi:hypothetical protein